MCSFILKLSNLRLFLFFSRKFYKKNVMPCISCFIELTVVEICLNFWVIIQYIDFFLQYISGRLAVGGKNVKKRWPVHKE